MCIRDSCSGSESPKDRVGLIGEVLAGSALTFSSEGALFSFLKGQSLIIIDEPLSTGDAGSGGVLDVNGYGNLGSALFNGRVPVSYTHLDVYKRQDLDEDEMYSFITKTVRDCTYFREYDEYSTVRKQN